jgi:hypothetical protein
MAGENFAEFQFNLCHFSTKIPSGWKCQNALQCARNVCELEKRCDEDEEKWRKMKREK